MVYKISSKPVNVMVIVKSIDGGTGTFLTNFLKIKKASLPRRINVKILALEYPSYRVADFSDFAFLRNKNFYPQKYSLSPINFLNLLQELIWIKEEMQNFKPTIVLGIDFRCNLLTQISKIFSPNIKTILTTHIDLASLTLNRSRGFIRLLFKLVIKYLYEKSDSLICVSRNLSLNLKNDFNIKKIIQTIYDGGDFKRGTQRLFLLHKKKIIVSVARLSIQKDYENLIRAVRLLASSYENFELWIAGDGSEKQNLKSLVRKLHLGKKIKFLGWVKSVDNLLKKSDIFVLSSKAEGFGYVLIEAMSQGLPVISTDTPYGPSEILGKGKYGILVPVGKERQLKDALLELLTNKLKYKYFSLRGLMRSKYFSNENMLNGYAKVFLNLAGKKL